MRHIRHDYNERVQDSAGIIPPDEPVFLLRAKDHNAATCVEAWAELVRSEGNDAAYEAAIEHARAMASWPSKAPTTTNDQHVGPPPRDPVRGTLVMAAVVFHDARVEPIPPDEQLLLVLDASTNDNPTGIDFRRGSRIGHYPDGSCLQVQAYNSATYDELPLHAALYWAIVRTAFVGRPDSDAQALKPHVLDAETLKRFDIASEDAGDRGQQCTIPPSGFYCTRPSGHDGPCAAHPIPETGG